MSQLLALIVEQRSVMPRAAFQCSWQIVNKAKRNQERRWLAQRERNLQ